MSSPTRTHVALLGGIERRGRWTAAPRLLHAALIGGADLDFTQAELHGPATTLVAVSAVGGVSVTVPPEVRVEATRFGLPIRADVGPSAASAAHILRVRAFTLLGGVKVVRAPVAGTA